MLNNDARYQALPKHPQDLLNEVQYEYTVGIPKGLFSSVPGLGIQTRRVGLTLEHRLILFTRVRRCFGVRDLTPSTPAVFFPWLSWVVRRTANILADHELINSFWSLRTNLTSPRLDARYILFCSLKTSRSSFRQFVSLHSYIGFNAPCS